MRSLPSLHALKVFEEVSRYPSFNRAAEALHLTQSAVSRQIRQLEDFLGVILFVRTPQGLSLTDAGRSLSGELNRAFADIEQAVHVLRIPGLHGRLRILAPPTWATRWLSPRLHGFCRLHPTLLLSVVNPVADQPPVDFDCRIRFDRGPATHGDSHLLRMERHLAVAAPALWHGGELEASARLHILHEGRRLSLWEAWQQAVGIELPDAGDLEFSTLDQVIHAACAGGGIAVVDRTMIERELRDGILRPLSPVEVVGPYGYWLDIPPDKRGLRKVDTFCAWLRQVAIGDT